LDTSLALQPAILGNHGIDKNALEYFQYVFNSGRYLVLVLSRDTVVEISQRFSSLNPYSFGGTILKVEAVNYQDSDPSQPFRDLHGYAISAKRYCLFEGKHARKIIDAKAHGIGYLINPIRRKGDQLGDEFAAAFWRKVLQNEGIALKTDEPHWLNRPAMMRIPVSSPAVLGRLKAFCKPYDFVLAPVIR